MFSFFSFLWTCSSRRRISVRLIEFAYHLVLCPVSSGFYGALSKAPSCGRDSIFFGGVGTPLTFKRKRTDFAAHSEGRCLRVDTGTFYLGGRRTKPKQWHLLSRLFLFIRKHGVFVWSDVFVSIHDSSGTFADWRTPSQRTWLEEKSRFLPWNLSENVYKVEELVLLI